MLTSSYKYFEDHIIPEPRSYYAWGDSVTPDVWFSPSQVWEVLAADLSLSPVHKAAFGLVDNGKGVALRFPRFVRIRDDKKPEQATSAEQVSELYKRQKITHVHNGPNDDDD
jgi:DNA ligase-1